MTFNPQRAQALFLAALQLPDAAARGEFLERECHGDHPLRQRVDALLRAHQSLEGQATSYSESADDPMIEPPLVLRPGMVLAGRYKLLEAIGEGGMGSVWLAEQKEPVKRKVALKLVKPDLSSRQLLARFEAERQALALMDHPNIAKVFDGGMTEQGRPFFAMEFVQGVPLTQYCDQARLSVRRRLELFLPICQAVQHAHQKGVIHRDLKPSNLLVCQYDGQPVPKVIDFGLAKAMHQPLTEQTLHTGLGVMVGTPLYMSPEQAEHNNLDVDTRTDVYSLGVILYELLTGSTPMERAQLKEAALNEVLRLIKEVDPPKPSTRLSSSENLPSIAAQRSIEPNHLRKALSGDLDWIAMKALEKERDRRYETANGLAADIHSYLAGEAVAAHPPTRAYRLKKFVRKNKRTVLAGVLIFAALLAGMIGTALGLVEARAHARRAEQQRRRAVAAERATLRWAEDLQLVSDFQAEMLAQVDPTRAGQLLTKIVESNYSAALAKQPVAESESVAQLPAFASFWQKVNSTDAARDLIDVTILQPAVVAIDRQFSDQPIIAAQLRQTLAKRYKDLGLFDAAMPLQSKALATRRQVLGNHHPKTLESVNFMGDLLYSVGRIDEAETFWREALEQRTRILGEEHRDTILSMNNMGVLLGAQGKLIEAESYYRRAIEKYRNTTGVDHKDALESIGNLGFALSAQGKPAEAEPYLREALEISRRVLGESHPTTLHSIVNLGALLRDEGKLDEAQLHLRDGLQHARRDLGEEHPITLRFVINLGMLLQFKEDNAGAVELLAPAVPATRNTFQGSNAWRFARLLLMLGKARTRLGDFAAAESNLLEAESIFDPSRDPSPNDARACVQALVELYTAWNAAEPNQGHAANATRWQQQLK